jgi:hypothetical protein
VPSAPAASSSTEGPVEAEPEVGGGRLAFRDADDPGATVTPRRRRSPVETLVLDEQGAVTRAHCHYRSVATVKL